MTKSTREKDCVLPSRVEPGVKVRVIRAPEQKKRESLASRESLSKEVDDVDVDAADGG